MASHSDDDVRSADIADGLPRVSWSRISGFVGLLSSKKPSVIQAAHIHGRIILDVDWVPTPGGEAKTAMGCFDRLQPLLPGAQGVIYDTALRGVHHQHLLRNLGWLPINKVTAAVASVKEPRRKGGERVEKSTFVEDRTVTLPNGTTVTVHLFALAGAIGIGQLDHTGTMVSTELTRIRTHRNPDRSGLFRWYNTYRLPHHLGAGTITIRLHATDDDTK